jgi:hypothetical protein
MNLGPLKFSCAEWGNLLFYSCRTKKIGNLPFGLFGFTYPTGPGNLAWKCLIGPLVKFEMNDLCIFRFELNQASKTVIRGCEFSVDQVEPLTIPMENAPDVVTG